jgi:hypothetical protein
MLVCLRTSTPQAEMRGVRPDKRDVVNSYGRFLYLSLGELCQAKVLAAFIKTRMRYIQTAAAQDVIRHSWVVGRRRHC